VTRSVPARLLIKNTHTHTHTHTLLVTWCVLKWCESLLDSVRKLCIIADKARARKCEKVVRASVRKLFIRARDQGEKVSYDSG
jgi:hypothetical protein